MLAACRNASFIVRKRPSRSTSARPIGSTSRKVCRLEDCASDMASLRSNSGQGIERRGIAKATQEERCLAPDALDLDRANPGNGRDTGNASGAIAPGHRLGQLKSLLRFLVGGQIERRMATTETLTIGGIDN